MCRYIYIPQYHLRVNITLILLKKLNFLKNLLFVVQYFYHHGLGGGCHNILYICIYMYIYMCINVYIYMCICIYMYIYVYICIYIYIYLSIIRYFYHHGLGGGCHNILYICMCMCIYMCIKNRNICIYACILYIYI
jgi:hypothetical protein